MRTTRFSFVRQLNPIEIIEAQDQAPSEEVVGYRDSDLIVARIQGHDK